MKIKIRTFKAVLRVIGLLLLCLIVVAAVAAVVFLTIIGFKAMQPIVRGIVALLACAIGILTIRIILKKFNFSDYFSIIVNDIYGMKSSYEQKLYQQYSSLKARYPLSLSAFESHCWKKTPKPSNYEIMEMALKVDNSVWVEEEKKEREKLK